MLVLHLNPLWIGPIFLVIIWLVGRLLNYFDEDLGMLCDVSLVILVWISAIIYIIIGIIYLMNHIKIVLT